MSSKKEKIEISEKEKNQNEATQAEKKDEKKSKKEEIKKKKMVSISQNELENLKEERNKFKNKYMMTMADFENFRKRSLKEKKDWIKNANQKIILDICDVNDNFQRAIESGVEKHQFESFLDGVKMIHKQIENLIDKEGVKEINPLGKEFDPKYHQALSRIPSEEFKEDKVAAVIQKGYMMNDKIIRAAKVAVSTGAPEQNQTENNENNKKNNNNK